MDRGDYGEHDGEAARAQGPVAEGHRNGSEARFRAGDRVLDELSTVIGANNAQMAPATVRPVPVGPAPSAKNVGLKAAGRVRRTVLAFDAGKAFLLRH